MVRIADKVSHVRQAQQTRAHRCHWPGCEREVPPAMWGCRWHWFALPKPLRDEVWRTYRPGQEIDGKPSQAYIAVMHQVRDWIASRPRKPPKAGPYQLDLFNKPSQR